MSKLIIMGTGEVITYCLYWEESYDDLFSPNEKPHLKPFKGFFCYHDIQSVLKVN